jgi:hypothetical protein
VSARARLPSRLTLPSGAAVTLRAVRPPGEPRRRAPDAPLFEETLAALDGEAVRLEGGALDPRGLALADFHVLRAVLTKTGYVAEEEITVDCRNCGAAISARPCERLEIGPWVDGELGDPELDQTLPFGEPHPIPEISLGRVRVARAVTFAARTVREAAPLLVALGRGPLDLDAALIRAMGLEALGAERAPARIARALAAADGRGFAAVTDAFLASHYPARLGAVHLCGACGARNDVDAPFEREFDHGVTEDRDRKIATEAFPSFDDFAARAEAIAAPMLARIPGEPVELVIEGETPAVDDGGEPLLGSYVPPHPGDGTSPTRSPRVTVYYRTFRAIWDEEGPYDWEDELDETIEHELEHHIGFLRGDDPMDDEERDAIRDEALRVVGRREAGRRAIGGFGASVQDFLRRTWPIWVIVAAALALMFASQR